MGVEVLEGRAKFNRIATHQPRIFDEWSGKSDGATPQLTNVSARNADNQPSPVNAVRT